ncbi:MAG: nucleotidyltransferase domain-containing protein [Nanoarchaeota archaeon]|nr:nucleotidyltransferase domain-containing protein [Nanoarchaeota archaeon]
MTKKHEEILKKILKNVDIEKEKLNLMERVSENFLKKLKKRIDKLDLVVDPFLGGSFAKKTLINKKNYDIDLFLRFNKKYKNEDLSKLTKKLLKGFKNVKKIKGSREYYMVKINHWLCIEVVPVRKITKIKDAINITDFSYSHVKYINKKIKNKNILDEIKLAKAFTYANKTYGAESYVHGFSGYALELLIYHYKSFLKMLEVLSKSKNKLIIDDEKYYKNKKDILLDLNSSKLDSPIILIDPTFKSRNVLAALSEATFEKFKQDAKDFLKKPCEEFFIKKKFDVINIIKNSKNILVFETKTKKQKGDIAGTKLLKFFRHFSYELKEYFEIKDFGFEYIDEKKGINVFVLTSKKKIICSGPSEKDLKNVEKFKLKHKKVFIEKGKYCYEKNLNIFPKEFFLKWKKKNKKKIKEMNINKLKLISY